MNIKILGTGDYEVVHGIIIERSGKAFTAKKNGNTLSLSPKGGSGTMMHNGDTILTSGVRNVGSRTYVNGISIITEGRTLIIDGDVDKIIHNGSILKEAKKDKIVEDKLEEDEYLTYTIEDTIDSIDVSGSGCLVVRADLCGCKLNDSLMFSVVGSGSILCTGTFSLKSIIATVAGSGDVILENIQTNSIIATVSGSGDVILGNIQADSITATVAGSGDITVKGCFFKNINKNITGSGDITGL